MTNFLVISNSPMMTITNSSTSFTSYQVTTYAPTPLAWAFVAVVVGSLGLVLWKMKSGRKPEDS